MVVVDRFQQELRSGFAMVGLASAGLPARDTYSSDDGLEALLRWRLGDPAWKPSFGDLLDDVRACIDPAARPSKVLAALAAMVRTDPSLSDRIRAVADEARSRIAAGQTLAAAPATEAPAARPAETTLFRMMGVPPA